MPTLAKVPSEPIGRGAVAGLLVGYFLVAALWTEVLAERSAPAGLVSPASGVALALVLLRGPRVWLLILAVALIHSFVALQSGPGSVLTLAVATEALAMSVVAALEPLLAASMIWRFTGEAYAERAGAFALAMLVAVPAAAFASTLPLILVQELPTDLIGEAGRGLGAAWYSTALKDVMGMMALTPPICIWARRPRLQIRPRRALELIAAMSAVGVVLAMPTAAQARYLLVALHIAIALRFSLKWSAASVALTSLAYLALGTLQLHGHPPQSLHAVFLSHVAFVIILNLATYVTAVLHMEVSARASQMQDLARALSEAEERERRRIAEILHDHQQQVLVAAKLALGRRSDAPTNRARALMDNAIESARTLMVELHPPVLELEGLATGLEWLAWHVRDLTGLNVEVEADPEANPPSPEIRAFLFQATRELLMNVVKHAETDRAWVQLRRDGPWIRVEVEDRGKGCTPKQVLQAQVTSRNFGVPAIRHRTDALGGRFEMVSEGGCRAAVLVPAGN